MKLAIRKKCSGCGKEIIINIYQNSLFIRRKPCPFCGTPEFIYFVNINNLKFDNFNCKKEFLSLLNSIGDEFRCFMIRKTLNFIKKKENKNIFKKRMEKRLK